MVIVDSNVPTLGVYPSWGPIMYKPSGVWIGFGVARLTSGEAANPAIKTPDVLKNVLRPVFNLLFIVVLPLVLKNHPLIPLDDCREC